MEHIHQSIIFLTSGRMSQLLNQLSQAADVDIGLALVGSGIKVDRACKVKFTWLHHRLV